MTARLNFAETNVHDADGKDSTGGRGLLCRIDADDGDNNKRSALVLGSLAAVGYFFTYFWKTTIFMLPQSVLNATVLTLGGGSGSNGNTGEAISLNTALAISQALGYFLGKLPAIKYMTSPLFFDNRFAVLSGLLAAGCLLNTAPFLFFHAVPWMPVLGVFLGSIPLTCVWGGLMTYLEGRKATEALVAMMTFSFILAGSASRGTAKLVLNVFLSDHPLWMPLALGMIALPCCLFFVRLVHKFPGPSAADKAQRSERAAMTTSQKIAFIHTYWPGLLALALVYAIMTAFRQYRDFYALFLFEQSLHTSVLPSAFLFGVDIPGALACSAFLLYMPRISSNARAVCAMLFASIISLALLLGSTVLFAKKSMSGTVWQVCVGASFYVVYGLLGSPISERIVASSGTTATASYLIFVLDACGYVGTIATLVINAASKSNDILHDFTHLVFVLSPVMIVAAFTSLVYFQRRLAVQGDYKRIAQHVSSDSL